MQNSRRRKNGQAVQINIGDVGKKVSLVPRLILEMAERADFLAHGGGGLWW